MSGEAKSELSAGGVAHHQDFCRVEVVALCDLREVPKSVADVFEGAGPTSAGVADATVFDVPGGEACGGQGSAEMSGVGEIVPGAPEASMDVHHHREWAFSFGQAKLGKLIGVGAVGEASVGGRWREGEDVVGGHRTYGYGVLRSLSRESR